MKKSTFLAIVIGMLLLNISLKAQSDNSSTIIFTGKPGTEIYLNREHIGTTSKKERIITLNNLKEDYYFLLIRNRKGESFEELLNIDGTHEYQYYLDEKSRHTTPNGEIKGLVKIVPIEEEIFVSVDEMPLFNGGEPRTEFINYVKDYCEIPEDVEATVYFQFIVTRYGYLSDIKILRAPDAALEREVRDALRSSPRWTPGKQNGLEVNVQYTLYVRF